jgi:hypothetical protein
LFYIGLDTLKFTKENLKTENYNIKHEILPELFELKYYHIIFILVTLTCAFFFKVITRLTVISLPLGLFILALALPFYPNNDPVLLLNLGEIVVILCITFIGSFQTDPIYHFFW